MPNIGDIVNKFLKAIENILIYLRYALPQLSWFWVIVFIVLPLLLFLASYYMFYDDNVKPIISGGNKKMKKNELRGKKNN